MFMAELWTQLGRVCCRVKWFFFGMSLGRKNSTYESFKGALGTQFRGFHAAAQLHCLCKLRTTITFSSKLRFGCSWTLWKPFDSTIHPYIA